MILDKQTRLSTDQAVTTDAGTTDYYDNGVARDVGINTGPMQFLVTVTEAATASGSATVVISVQCDDNTGFSSPKTVYSTPAIPKATLVIGYQLFLPLPIGLDERYFRLAYTIATGPLTAGKVTVDLIKGGEQKNKAYPDALAAI